MAQKSGLLIAPAFPPDSFWSFKYIMKYIGRKAAFPPFGLLTFASLMPEEEWEFDLIDLNVQSPGEGDLRDKIKNSDAVFAGGMNIQRNSLAELLDGPARGTDTPWVLGGPMASTYRDTILNPQTETDHILHDGLDYLVWGEAGLWIEDLNLALRERTQHTGETPHIFIPERVLNEPDGSRKYLLDKDIFKPLENMPVPRWDLINVHNYRAMMLQSTAGCRFRCNFCDIVQFNGGFARAKDKAAIKKELQAIYDTDFRGGVFTVDDNFVSEPAAMEDILEGMIEFQRENNYPFNFFTQASIDLGKESLGYLIPLMKQAGFNAVFLGIENPDPAALKGMNKIQNIKTDPKETVSKLQEQGIEVYAGFIFGTDADTRQTADLIVDFVKGNGIFSSMTGKLTPMPHTPLYVELKEQGRLIEGSDASNNVDDSLQYRPVMSVEHLQEGFSHILNSLFNRQELYDRARSVLDRVDAHIFREKSIASRKRTAALRSFLTPGLRGRDGRIDSEYFRFIKEAFQWDRRFVRQTRNEEKRLIQFWNSVAASANDAIELDAHGTKQFSKLLDYAHEAQVRYSTDKKLDEIHEFVHSVRDSLAKGFIVLDHAQSVYKSSMDYLSAKRDLFRFPGAHLIKAFELTVMGSHYQIVVNNVLATGDAESLHMSL